MTRWGRYEKPDEAAAHEAWASGLAAALNKDGPGVYMNF
jgi:hypothetical protein